MILADISPARAAPATVYGVLADAARSRSARYLVTEGLVAAATAVGVLLLAPRWWPLAAAAASVAAYAAWWLLEHAASVVPGRPPRARRAAQGVLVVLATAGVLA